MDDMSKVRKGSAINESGEPARACEAAVTRRRLYLPPPTEQFKFTVGREKKKLGIVSLMASVLSPWSCHTVWGLGLMLCNN